MQAEHQVKSEIIELIILKVYPHGAILTTEMDDVPAEHRFWTISAGGRPRWIVPQLPKLGFPTLRQWRPYGVSSWIKWQALLILYRVGLLGCVPGVKSYGISGLYLPVWSHIFWRNSTPPAITIYIGSPGVTCKAVVTLAQQDNGQPVAIMKIPLGANAAASIAQESNALLGIENHKLRVAPKLLHHNPNSGWSLQEAINGSSVGMRLTESHYDFLCKLNNSVSFASLAELSISLLKRLNKLNSLSFDERLILNRLLQQINEDTPITVGRVHGDFAPWNLKWAKKHVLIAVDWEFSELCEPIGLDLIHYLCCINGRLRCGNYSPESFEFSIVNRMKKFKAGLYPTHEQFLKQLLRYYLVWYQVVLEERGITNSVRLDYQRITKGLLNGSL